MKSNLLVVQGNMLSISVYSFWTLLILLVIAIIGIIFIVNKIAKQKKQILNWERQERQNEDLQQETALELEEVKNKLKDALAKLEEWNKLIPDLKEIARLDHDINTPLCVVTLSLGRAQKVGREQHDEALLSMVNDILGAVNQIGEIMQKVVVLKKSPLISYKSGGNNVGEERGKV